MADSPGKSDEMLRQHVVKGDKRKKREEMVGHHVVKEAKRKKREEMVRHHVVKGAKRKKREERCDKDEGQTHEQREKPFLRAHMYGKEMSMEENSKEIEQLEEEVEVEVEGKSHEMDSIPIVPSDQKTKKPGVIFVLEKASLEVAKVGKSYQILCSEDHSNFLRKNKKDPAAYRPDIAHQALVTILDSPINKAGRLKAVYVKTDKGVLLKVSPHVRIPRTYKRFAGLMSQLLQKLSISAVGEREKLLHVIKNPVTQYLPVNSHKIGFSYSSEKLVEMSKHVATVGDDKDLVFVVGAMAHGKIDCDYIDDFVAVSGYPLSAEWCIGMVCEALADKWDVL